MRKIGFDFDGVLAEKVSFNGDIKKYRNDLLNAKPLLNPYKIKRSDDEIYIITGRYIEHYYFTIKWLNRVYPKFDSNNLHFANNSLLDDNYNKNYPRFILHISRMKLKKIIDLDLDIYFEDTEFTINFLRKYIGRICKIIDIKDVETIDFKKWLKGDMKLKTIKLKDLKNIKDIKYIRFFGDK